MPSVKVPPSKATAAPKHKPTDSVVPATAFTRSGSPAPHAWPISTAAPVPKPIMNAMRKNKSGKNDDTAAIAETPIIWPM